MSLSPQRSAIEEWVSREEPQRFPIDRELLVPDILENDLIPLFPIGELLVFSRNATRSVLLVSTQRSTPVYAPEKRVYEYVGLFYETAPNKLEWLQQRDRAVRIEALKQLNDAPAQQNDSPFLVPELDQWKSASPEEEDSGQVMVTPWDEALAEELSNTIIFMGKVIRLNEIDDTKEEKDPYELRREEILRSRSVRSSCHIEPVYIRSITKSNILAVLSGSPYSYVDRY
jgi:hypothetical protein